jgi:hypothetical protein
LHCCVTNLEFNLALLIDVILNEHLPSFALYFGAFDNAFSYRHMLILIFLKELLILYW